MRSNADITPDGRADSHVHYFMKPGDTSHVKVDKRWLARERRFIWDDTIRYQDDEDRKKVMAHIPSLRDATYINMAEWKDILLTHNNSESYFAVYDTGECGLGLIAVNDIEENATLLYPGVWRFEQEGGKTPDDFTLYDRDGTPYGRVDGSQYRNMAVLAQCGPNKSELDEFLFPVDKVKKIATNNMAMHLLIPPPETGIPFVLALRQIAPIKKGDPVLHKYSDNYFLEIDQAERFFLRGTGKILDPRTYYANRKTVRVVMGKNLWADIPGVTSSDREMGLSVLSDRGPIVISSEEFAKNNLKDPYGRYMVIHRSPEAKPESVPCTSREEEKKPASPAQLGKFSATDPARELRCRAATKNISPADFEKFLIANKEVVNKPADNGMCALHHAAKKGDTEKVKLLIKHNADITKKAGEKTALDFAMESENCSEALLRLLGFTGERAPLQLTENRLRIG